MLLCDHVIRSLDASQSDDPRLDWVDLDWDECRRRALRKRSRSGRLVRILPRVGVTLRHRDVLADTCDLLLAISVNPADVIVAHPTSLEQAVHLALLWGNLHLPVEIGADAVITVDDGPAMVAIDQLTLSFSREQRRFQPTSVPGLIWQVNRQCR